MTSVFPRPPSDLIDPPAPPPPDVIASAWLARRYNLPPATANAVRELALLATFKEAR